MVAAFLIASSLMVDGLPFFGGGVSAEEPPTEVDVTPTPTPVLSLPPSPATNFVPLSPSIAKNILPTPRTNSPTTTSPTLSPVVIRKEAVRVFFDMELDYTGNASFDQITKDIDGVLENFIFRNLRFLEGQGLDIRDVMLGVTVATRRLQTENVFLRRWMQEPAFDIRGLVVQVDGNVIYDIDAERCVECIDEEIETELEQLLTTDALDEVIRSAQIDGVKGVMEVREATIEDLSNNNSNTGTQLLGAQGAEDDGLERPSTLAIAFGFVLTAIAAMGLLFYAYLFFKKRKKRLKKEQQQRQSIEYQMPSSRVTPTSANKAPKQSPVPPPPAPTSASTRIPDDRSVDLSVKELEIASSDAGPGDAFALELEMAASRDQQAWENFQRKKRTLDYNREIQQTNSGHMESTSPIPTSPIPPPQTNIAPPVQSEAWQKSFPYGDESGGLQDQGVEWTDEDFGIEEKKWEPYNSNVLYQPEEKKDDTGLISRVAPDPEPAIPVARESPIVLQSIEHTLGQYGSDDVDVQDDAQSEVVDEVARLSRFVQRLEKRKERRIQRGSERSAPESSPASYSSQPAVQQFTSPNQNENNGYLNNMRPRQHGDLLQDSQPKKKSPYMGITMTGEMYQDPSLQTMSHPGLSMSEDSGDDSYQYYEDENARNQRLGITPFSVQRPKGSSPYGLDTSSPAVGVMSRNLDREEPSTNYGSVRRSLPMDSNRIEQRPRTKSEGESFHTQRARLQDLRKNEAIIDSSRSEINVGNHPNLGEDRVPVPAPQEQQRPRVPFFNKAGNNPQPPNPNGQNPRFSKLRNLFEERPKNAIFPPDEHWQSGKLLDSNKR
jgi:hypothetical protein